MSYNRLTYDNCAYSTEIKESTGSLEYNLFVGKYENCKQCPVGDFANNIDFDKLADVESELFGLNRPGTLCPSLKYDPTQKFKYQELSPARMCESIHYITPNNLVKPTTNMIDEKNLGLNVCANNVKK
jgi:hypothetical protein